MVAMLLGVEEAATRSTNSGPPAPVPIFQHEWEFATLVRLYKQRRPRRVLEVGSYYGGTLYHWLTNAQPGATIVSVDSYAIPDADNRSRYQDWAPAGVKVHVIAGDSRAADTIEQAARLAPYQWAFIDAGHYYDEVLADWQHYRPLVADGGIVALHDILPPSAQHPEIEVSRLWREIQLEGYVTQELVADPSADWGGIGVVYV